MKCSDRNMLHIVYVYIYIYTYVHLLGIQCGPPKRDCWFVNFMNTIIDHQLCYCFETSLSRLLE